MATASSSLIHHPFHTLTNFSSESRPKPLALPSPVWTTAEGSAAPSRLAIPNFILVAPFGGRFRYLSASVSAASSYFGSDEEEEEEEEALARKKPPPPSDAGRLYVGNLPFSMTPAQLSEVFCQAGPVDSVEVVYDRVTDRSRGFAFVTMASADAARDAIRMFDGTQVGGRTVKVNFPEVPRGGEKEAVAGPRQRGTPRGFVDSPHKVYAGNLGWTVTSESLRAAFAGQRGLLGARVVYERISGRSSGYGFVSFGSAEDARDAIEALNEVELEGRPLRLSIASRRAAVTAAGVET